MKPKNIIIAFLIALVIIILFNNTEESSFWLFGEIRTSKLIILGIFFVLGVVTGGILFRRRKKHPTEYIVNNPNTPREENNPPVEAYLERGSDLSDEDRDFIRKD